VLEALSLAGSLPAEVVAGLAAEGALDGLIDQGLLTTHVAGDGDAAGAGRATVHLAHPIYGVVLRDGLDPTRADRLRRRVLDALEARPDRSTLETVRLETLRLDHGIDVDTPQLVTAARYAQAASSQAVAARLPGGPGAVDRVAAAMAGSGAVPPPSEGDLAAAERLAAAAWERGRAQAAGLALTTILIARGRADAAERVIAELASRAGASEDLAPLALARAALLFWVRGRPDDALDVLRSAEAAVGVDADAVRRLQRLRAGIALNVGQVGEAVEVATRLMDAAGPSDAFGALAAATAAAGLTLAGRPHDAVAVVDRHLAVAQAYVLDIPEALGQLLLARIQAARVLGDLDSAEWFAYACYQTAADHGALGAMAVFVGALGQVALDRGRPATATRRLREAEVLLREHDSFGYRPLVVAYLTMALAQSGGGEAGHAPAAPAPPPAPADHERFFDADLLLADAWRQAADGRLDHAVATALASAERARTAGLQPAEALALHAVVRFGDPTPVAARARELALAVGSPLLAACAAHADAAAAADGAAMEGVAATFAGLGARLLAAEAAGAAAVIHDGQGDRGAARRAHARSHALAEGCEGATTPALRLAARTPLLTAREHEVAMLAAAGLTSKAIAGRLVVSPRTVESHLYRVFAKLGVEDRSQLAEVLLVVSPTHVASAGPPPDNP
jgi:DNA-binding CsgD family transcriptional regulator